jgi:hypothetical protein
MGSVSPLRLVSAQQVRRQAQQSIRHRVAACRLYGDIHDAGRVCVAPRRQVQALVEPELVQALLVKLTAKRLADPASDGFRSRPRRARCSTKWGRGADLIALGADGTIVEEGNTRNTPLMAAARRTS